MFPQDAKQSIWVPERLVRTVDSSIQRPEDKARSRDPVGAAEAEEDGRFLRDDPAPAFAPFPASYLCSALICLFSQGCSTPEGK